MRKKKVLICDDDMDFNKILVLRLAKNNYEVKIAVDGSQVMSHARKWQPDCIVLDVNMPGGNAYQTLRLLEQNPNTLAIPIVLISGQSPDFSRISEIHQSNFIKKPFATTLLIEKIENLLSSNSEQTAEEEISRRSPNVSA
jgi:DNA-binding response OmpR family regulator